MIVSDKLLFIHVPKTGGQSISQMLLDTLPPPVYFVHENQKSPPLRSGVEHIHALRHANLRVAREIVAKLGYSLEGFPLIIAVLRNPYALEVSRFAYLMQQEPGENASERRRRVHEIVSNESFETFAKEVDLSSGGAEWGIDTFFRLDGHIPPNLRILRLEKIDEDLRAALATVGIEMEGNLPWVNASPHGDYLDYYTRAAEEAVYEKYRWVFDSGYYERLDPSRFEFVEETREDRRDQMMARLRRRVNALRSAITTQQTRLDVQAGLLAEERERADALAAELDGLRSMRAGIIEARDTVKALRDEVEELQATGGAKAQAEIERLKELQADTAAALAQHESALAVQEAVRVAVPLDATVLVVSHGDPELLALDGREAWHFPCTPEGWYAGEYPADSAVAVAHLEELRAKGGTHLLIPAASSWWLEHYAEFRGHLDKNYCCSYADEACVVYDLAQR